VVESDIPETFGDTGDVGEMIGGDEEEDVPEQGVWQAGEGLASMEGALEMELGGVVYARCLYVLLTVLVMLSPVSCDGMRSCWWCCPSEWMCDVVVVVHGRSWEDGFHKLNTTL